MPLLREWLLMPLSPLWNNISCTLLTLAYVKAAMEGATWIRLRLNSKLEAQQLVHIAISSLLLFWPLYDKTDWSWRLNVLVPAVLATRLAFKAALVRDPDPDDEDVLIMSRTSAPSGLLYGPLQLNLLLVYLGLFQFMEEEASILLAAVGIGDGIAPLIGKRHGRHVYHVPLSHKKTMEGSLVGVFLGTVAGCYFFPYVLGIPVRPLRVVLALSGIAALVEGTSPVNMDNIMIPLVLHLSFERVDHWLADLA